MRQPDWSNAGVDLYLGDCLEILPELEAGSVDMIFADPPFNVGKKYGGKSGSDNRDDYYDWCSSWIYECFRLLKDTGTFYLMTLDRHQYKIGTMMEKYGVFASSIKWRNVSAVHSKRSYWPTSQPILMFGKTDNYKFNPYAQTRKTLLPWSSKRKENMKGQLLDYWDDIPYVYAGSITHPEAILKNGTNEKLHPAQMPIALPKRGIVFSTDEHEIVLDPFCGSGSTGVACAITNRKFIGIDRVDEYIKLTERRISQAQLQIRMEI